MHATSRFGATAQRVAHRQATVATPLLGAISAALLACGPGHVPEAGDAGPPPASAAGFAQYGYDLGNSQAPQGTGIDAAALDGLAQTFRAQVGAGATSTPVIVDDTVYFGAWDGHLYALDVRDGSLRWKRRLGEAFVRSTPLVTEDSVYVGADRTLFRLDRADGEVRFERELIDHPQGLLESSPKLADGVLVLGLASFELNLLKDDYDFVGAVVGLDARDGELLWELPVTGGGDGPCTGGAGVSVWSSAAIDPELGLAYIGTGQTYEAPASNCNDSLLAIHYQREHDGPRLAWKATYTEDDVYIAAGGGLNGLDHDVGAAPNLFAAGEVPAVGAGDKGGSYRAFDRRDGTPLWHTDLDNGPLSQLGGVMTTAAVAGDTIYVASNHWRVYGFVVAGRHSEMDTATLYALDTATGEPRWEQPIESPIIGTFAVTDDLLWHPTIVGTLYARSLSDGAVRFMHDVGAPMGSGIGVEDGTLMVSAGFTLGGTPGPAYVTAFSTGGDGAREIDLRSDDAADYSLPECDARLADFALSDACRACVCECDASAAGACSEACWAQAPCIVENCVDAEYGLACYSESCTSKLLPPNVYRESVGSYDCVMSCRQTCEF